MCCYEPRTVSGNRALLDLLFLGGLQNLHDIYIAQDLPFEVPPFDDRITEGIGIVGL